MEGTDIVIDSTLLMIAIMAPGFALTLALIPKIDSIPTAERIGLSLVFGIIPHLALYFLANNFSIPVTTATSITSILAVTILSLIVWRIRFAKQPINAA